MLRKFQILTIPFAALAVSAFLLSGAGNDDRYASTNTTVGAATLAAQSGGCAATLKTGSVLITGGRNAGGPTNGAQLFSARNGAQAVASMLSPREGHACAVLSDGRVLVAGGTTLGNGITNSAEIFDPSTGRWTATGSLAVGRSGAAGVPVAGGRILVAGGASNSGATNTIEVFDPATNSFRAVPALLSSPRTQHATVALSNGKVLIAGGSSGAAPLDTIDVFDPATNTVTPLGKKLSSPRAGLSATVLLDGRVYLAGGNDGRQDLASTEIFNPKTGLTLPAAPMSVARTGHLAIRVPNNNSVLIVGGNTKGGLVSSQEVYVPWWNAYKPFGGPGNNGKASALPLAGDSAVLLPQAESADMAADGDPSVLPTLYTDKPDYSPGETATITGSGWTPGSTLTLLLQRDPLTLADTTWTATVDALGNFTTTYLVQSLDLNVTFTLTVTSDAGDTAQVLSFTDAAKATTTALTSTVNPSNSGQSVTFTATVTPESSNVTDGTVQFKDGATLLTTVTLNNTNVATYTTSSLSGGVHSMSAVYSGSSSTPGFLASTGTLSQTVYGARTTSLTVSLGAGTLQPGQQTSVSVQVADTQAGAVAPTGTVTLSSSGGDTFSGACTLSASGNNGNCSVTLTASATNGGRTITATYPGDTNHAGSSNTTSLTVSSTVASSLAVAAATGTYGGSAALSATLTAGGNPVSGKTVSFTLNGVAAGSAVTNASGVASIASASLTGINAGSYPTGVAASFAGDSSYTASSGANSLAVSKANATINVTGYTVTYDGNAHTATGTATGVGGVNLAAGLNLSGTTHTNAGTYASDAWTYTDASGNYNNTSGTVSDTINKATATINVTGYTVTYDGNAHTATGTATGVGGLNLAAGLNLSGTTHTNAGTYASDSWTYTDASGNYNNASGTVSDTINKATATINVTGYTVTYDGNAHTATGTATGVGGANLNSLLNLSGTTHTNAGSYPADAWSFSDPQGNYSNANGTVSDTINKATATISVTPYSVTYDGNAHTASGTATGVKGEPLSGLDLSHTTHTTAGTYAADYWTFTDPNGNYLPVTNTTITDSIAKANPTVNVTPYSVTFDGNAHTASGTATGVKNEALSGLDLTGTTHTNAGTYGTDAWTFTDVTGNYNNASGTVSDSIAKANASISVTGYNVTYDANPHTATGTATGVGNVNLAAGLNLSGTTHTTAGTYSDSWTYTDASGNYNNASGSVSDVIGKATATINVTGYTVTYDGNAHSATGTATGVGGANLSAGLNLSGTSHTDAGTYSLDPWSFSDASGNYNNASGTVSDVINKATATINVTGYNVTYDGNPHTATGTATGVKNEALTGLVLSGTTHTSSGTYNGDAWSFSNANYNTANGTVNDVINKANASITVTPYTVTYDGTAHTAAGTAKGVNNETLTGLDLSHTTHTTAGTYSADYWSFTDATGNYNSVGNTTITDTINKANATISVTPYNVTYDGNQHTATGTAKGVSNENLAGLDLAATAHTNAGSYSSDQWTFTDITGNYNSTSGYVSDSIAKANVTINVTGYNVTYDGESHTATGTATGVKSEALSGLSLTGTTHTTAGAYTDSWSFTDATGNYNNTTGSVSDTIGKATANITVTGYTVTYDGDPHTATASATGVKGESLTGFVLTATTHTNAGTYSGDAWSFSNANYKDASGTVNDAINKANATILVTPYTLTYDGNSHTAAGSAKGVKNETLSGLDLSQTAHTNAGTYSSDSWSFTDVTGNYNSVASTTITDTINKANATISVQPYTVTYDATSHTATGTATGVKGESLSGLNLTNTTHTNAGTYNSDSWSFTDVTGNYNNVASTTITDTINKATPAFSGLSAPTITFGSGPTNLGGALAAGSLIPTGNVSITLAGMPAQNAAIGVAGAFSSSFATSAYPVPGGTITYAYAGDTNFSPVSTNRSLSVNQYAENGTAGASPTPQSYTQPVTFTAAIPVTGVGGRTAATGVNFWICPNGATATGASCQKMTAAPVALSPSGGGLAGTSSPIALVETVAGALAPGAHTVLAEFTGVDANYLLNVPSAALTINPKAAVPMGQTFYTGATVYWTPNATSSTATLTLTATVVDPCKDLPPGYQVCGNVTKGNATFSLVNGTSVTPIVGATNLPIGLVNTNDTSVGTAAATVQYNLGNANSAPLEIRVTVGGYYTSNDPSTDATVFVSKPLGVGEMKLGGALLCNSKTSVVPPNATNKYGTCATDSLWPTAGTLPGDTAKLTQFNGDITFNKSGTNPQGYVQAFVVSMYKPDGTMDMAPHTYQIKSNSISTFSGLTGGLGAAFSAKATIQDLTTGATVDGGAIMQITACAPGSDKACGMAVGTAGAISVQVNSSKTGAVWFSSGWNGKQTVVQNAAAGIVQIN